MRLQENLKTPLWEKRENLWFGIPFSSGMRGVYGRAPVPLGASVSLGGAEEAEFGFPYLQSQPGLTGAGSLTRAPCHGVSAPPLTAGFAGSNLLGRWEHTETPSCAGSTPQRRQLSRALRDHAAVLGEHKPQVNDRGTRELSVAQLQQQLPAIGEFRPPYWTEPGPEAQWTQLGLVPAAGCKDLELRRALLPHLRRSNSRGDGQDQRLQ